MSHERLLACDYIPIAAFGLLVAAGCATMNTAGHIEEVSVDSLYGTWQLTNDTGERDWEAHGGQLILNADAHYMMTEVGDGHSSYSEGQFSVYQVAAQDSLDPWIEFQPSGYTSRRQRVFQFSGPDTLLVRDGDSGRTIDGSHIDLYVRESSGRLPEKDYDQGPEPVTAPPPVYPEFARDAGITGKVVLHLLVGENGRVQRVVIIQGKTGLNEAAVNAAGKWIFKPALKNGLAVSAWYELPMEFHY